MDENIVFGKSLQKKDEWNAGYLYIALISKLFEIIEFL